MKNRILSVTAGTLIMAFLVSGCAPKSDYLDGYKAGYQNAKRHCEAGKFEQ